MLHIGIDIGTSYSSVSILNEKGQPERVKIATGTSVFGDSYSLPSAVFAETDGNLLLGQAATASRMRAPQNFKNEFKRDLGQLAPYLLGGKPYLPEDLYKEFFIYIKRCVEDYTQESVSGATITFPAMFNENKKKLIESAAKRAGLLDIKMLDEPSAAAYCYLNAGKISEGDKLLVYDLGGGTFDVALICVKDGKFEPLAQPMGNPRLGGADFDRMIVDDIMAQIGEEKIGPIKANPVNHSRFVTMVVELAVKAKHHLSSSSVFSDIISVGYDAVEYTLERNRYNEMIAPLIDDTINCVRAILQSANLKPADVNKVLRVGGARRTPLVGDMLSHELGKQPLKDVDPELAVCEGAVVMSIFMRKLAEDEQKRIEEERRRQEEQKKEEDEKRLKLEKERKIQETVIPNNQVVYPWGFCLQCGHENPIGTNYCLRCGTRLQQRQQAQEDPKNIIKKDGWKEEERKLSDEEKRAEQNVSNIVFSCDAKLTTQALKFALKGQLIMTPDKLTFYVSKDHWAYSGAKEFVLVTNEIFRVERQPFRTETAGGAAAMLIPQVAIVKGIAKIPNNKRGVKVIGKHTDYLFGFENEAGATSFEMILRQYI